jgi:hypothetical protein
MHYKRWKRNGGPWLSRPVYGSEDVGYSGLHKRLEKFNKGPCASCGREENVQWALNWEGDDIRFDGNHYYSPNLENYFLLCASCHKIYDKGQICIQRVSGSMKSLTS